MTRKQITKSLPKYRGAKGFIRAAKTGFSEIGHQAGKAGKQTGKTLNIAVRTAAPQIRRGATAFGHGIVETSRTLIRARGALDAMGTYLNELREMRARQVITKQEYELAVLRLRLETVKQRAEMAKIQARLPPSRLRKAGRLFKEQMTTDWDAKERMREKLESA